jgi:hypothetical protein
MFFSTMRFLTITPMTDTRLKSVTSYFQMASEEEHRLYQFLLCNYLAYVCGRLPADRMNHLNGLQIDWIKHVEMQENIRKKITLSVEAAREYAMEAFRDNQEAFLMFEEMTR